MNQKLIELYENDTVLNDVNYINSEFEHDEKWDKRLNEAALIYIGPMHK